MFWNIVFLCISWTVTAYWSAWGLSIPSLILRVSFPLIRLLEISALIDGKRARASNRRQLLLWLCIDAALIALLVYLSNIWIWSGFCVGCLILLFKAFPKTKATNDEAKFAFLEANFNFLPPYGVNRAKAYIHYYPHIPSHEEIELIEQRIENLARNAEMKETSV